MAIHVIIYTQVYLPGVLPLGSRSNGLKFSSVRGLSGSHSLFEEYPKALPHGERRAVYSFMRTTRNAALAAKRFSHGKQWGDSRT